MNARRFFMFCAAVWELSQQFPGMATTSWGRSLTRNKMVGGHSKSQHMTWTAMDVVFDRGSEPEGPVFAKAAKVVGLTAVYEVITGTCS